MKAFFYALVMMVLTMSYSMAGEFQTIDGAEAYETYLKLPGVTCQEYRLAQYVVLSKYQTKSCNVNQTDSSKWNCTVQFILKNGKKSEVASASCSREI